MRKYTILILLGIAVLVTSGCFSFPKKETVDALEHLKESSQVQVITEQIHQEPKANATLGLTFIGGALIIVSQVFVFLGNPRGWLGVLAGAGIAAGPWIFDSTWFKWAAGGASAAVLLGLLIYGYQRFLKRFFVRGDS
jgi:hypothetical protein